MAKNIIRGVGAVGFFVLSAATSWGLYSRYAIDHNMPLPAPLDVEGATLVTEAGDVRYYADTSAEGRPIVLIHSINAASNAYEMRPLFEYYQGERPVYALDLPGFGLSERRDQVYSAQLYSDVIEQFLNEVVGQPADVVALSLGGEFAARATLNQPEAVNTLVILAPTGLNEPPEFGDGLYNTLSFPLWRQPLYDLLVTRGSLNLFLSQIFYGEIPSAYLEYAYLTTHQPGARYAPLYFVGGQLFSSDIQTAVYEQLDLPVLAIYGDDPNVSFETLPALLDANPNWQALRFEKTRAVPHWDELEATIAALESFWAGEATE